MAPARGGRRVVVAGEHHDRARRDVLDGLVEVARGPGDGQRQPQGEEQRSRTSIGNLRFSQEDIP